MVKKLKNKVENGALDYKNIEGNKALIDLDNDYRDLSKKCDIEDIIKSQGEFKRFIYGCQANNESLPFQDNTFDSYISNLSLHIVTEPKNQIAEAYRVLKTGGAACFTVWGRKSETL